MSRAISWLIVLATLPAAAALADDDADREALRYELETLVDTGYLSTSDAEIAAVGLIVEIYERRNFLPTWNDQRQIQELISVIEATEEDGLSPDDYHLRHVEYAYQELLAGRLSEPGEWAAKDLILTDSLIRLGYHQTFGKVNPYSLDPHWNFRRELNDIDPATAIQEAIDAPSLSGYLDAAIPRDWVYRNLQEGLRRYRQIAADGGWPGIPGGPVLKPGARDERLPVLARRLMISGDLDDELPVSDEMLYDEALQAGVRRFQDRHGLDVDAVIGPATLRTMNVPVEQRIGQLEINLERARWVLDDVADDLVIVNIAGFRLYVIRDREIVWNTNVQVGTQYHQTPVFRDELKYLVLNPTWTVPFSIATKEILPRIKSDPAYLAGRDFDVKDRSGKFVEAASVEWSELSRGNFPYWLVQRPGPGNALGRIKFMFPNEHAVYLHDTPSKHLFDRAERTFSHGCIRVERPFELAELLLDSEHWTKDRIQQQLDTLQTRAVFLPEPLPVLLLYWTALVDPDGVVRFYRDVYSRDRRIARLLDEPFDLDLPGA